MGQSHQSGAQRGARIGNEPLIHTFPIDWSLHVAATNYKLITFKVTPAKPLLIRSNILVATQGDGTTQTASVGTAAAGTQWHNAVDMKAVQNTNYNNALGSAGAWIVYKSTDAAVVNGVLSIWLARNQTGAPTAGRSYLIIEVAEINTKTQGRSV